jgi:hypothetical protein
MNPQKRRYCYTIAFKCAVIEYAKEHGNRAAERQFGPQPTEKMIRTWRKQEQQLKEAKCGISNSLDGTEDNLLLEDSDDSVPDSEELSSVSSSEDEDFCGFEDED